MKRPVFKPKDSIRARELRNRATPTERKLWQHLSRSQISGNKFSRQIQIGPYYADFVCRKAKMVIEIDGFSHDGRQEYDARRTKYLEAEGYTVLRFLNTDVFDNLEGVLVTIQTALENLPTPGPSCKREGRA